MNLNLKCKEKHSNLSCYQKFKIFNKVNMKRKVEMNFKILNPKKNNLNSSNLKQLPSRKKYLDEIN